MYINRLLNKQGVCIYTYYIYTYIYIKSLLGKGISHLLFSIKYIPGQFPWHVFQLRRKDALSLLLKAKVSKGITLLTQGALQEHYGSYTAGVLEQSGVGADSYTSSDGLQGFVTQSKEQTNAWLLQPLP